MYSVIVHRYTYNLYKVSLFVTKRIMLMIVVIVRTCYSNRSKQSSKQYYPVPTDIFLYFYFISQTCACKGFQQLQNKIDIWQESTKTLFIFFYFPLVRKF
jgi:hypothetical protein